MRAVLRVTSSHIKGLYIHSYIYKVILKILSNSYKVGAVLDPCLTQCLRSGGCRFQGTEGQGGLLEPTGSHYGRKSGLWFSEGMAELKECTQGFVV